MRLAYNYLPVGSLIIFRCTHNAINEWVFSITSNRLVPFQFEPYADNPHTWDYEKRFEKLPRGSSVETIIDLIGQRTNRVVNRTKTYFDDLDVWEVVS